MYEKNKKNTVKFTQMLLIKLYVKILLRKM